ncbi:MAG TPA: hypothetical protein ACFCUY_03685 [Xenococcaceae cyanobacterium]
MNQQNLKAYLDLIQGLLSCPRGEEWILLRQHEALVNPELVEIMEQVASHLAVEGDVKAAKYLHNWAGKLHHILTEKASSPQTQQDKTQAYLELIQALLSCPKGSEAEILAANRELIGPELVKMMQQVANQIAGDGNEATASFLQNLATDLNRTWLQHHEFKPSLKKEIAPDPWSDETATSQPPAVTAANSTESTPPSLGSQIENTQQLAQQLSKIANALVQLETALASRLQLANPLWYMEVLEKAAAANWILTTEEVEQLIGIKPQCHHDETSYQRGSWLFIKAGKIGAQIGWRVEKQNNSISETELN